MRPSTICSSRKRPSRTDRERGEGDPSYPGRRSSSTRQSRDPQNPIPTFMTRVCSSAGLIRSTFDLRPAIEDATWFRPSRGSASAFADLLDLTAASLAAMAGTQAPSPALGPTATVLWSAAKPSSAQRDLGTGLKNYLPLIQSRGQHLDPEPYVHLCAFIDYCQVLVLELQAKSSRHGDREMQRAILRAPQSEVRAVQLVVSDVLSRVARATRLSVSCVSYPSSRVTSVGQVTTPTELRHVNLMSKMKRFVLLHIGDVNLSTTTVAASLGVSRSHLCRILKAQCGLTFRQFVGNIRIDRAMQLLEEDFQSVKEVAASVGLRSTSELDRQFLRLVGITPTAFRLVARKSRIDS